MKKIITDYNAGAVATVNDDGTPASHDMVVSLGERVWVYNGQHGRRMGTSAEYITLPQEQAVFLPDQADFHVGACMGIPAMTAHRCVMADGPVSGKLILVTGGAGRVGHYAIQLAKHKGAEVIATAGSARPGRSSPRREGPSPPVARPPNAPGHVEEMRILKTSPKDFDKWLKRFKPKPWLIPILSKKKEPVFFVVATSYGHQEVRNKSTVLKNAVIYSIKKGGMILVGEL